MEPDVAVVHGYRHVVPRAKKPDLKALIRDVVSAMGADSSCHLNRAALALRLAADADRYARIEVMAARELDAASWADVGAALGMTRQAAHERFRTGPDGFHSRWYKLRSAK